MSATMTWKRDRMVFEFAKAENIPVAWVLAGGYCQEIEKVVRVHLNTAQACWEVFGEKISRLSI